MEEVKLFQKTLQAGKKVLEEMIDGISSAKISSTLEKSPLPSFTKGGYTKGVLTGVEIFKLYDTYGFPVELTKEIAQERGLAVDEEGFQQALEEAKEKSRQATKEMFKKGIDWSKYLE
jgi:alanyl-tRNA synthetase